MSEHDLSVTDDLLTPIRLTSIDYGARIACNHCQV